MPHDDELTDTFKYHKLKREVRETIIRMHDGQLIIGALLRLIDHLNDRIEALEKKVTKV